MRERSLRLLVLLALGTLASAAAPPPPAFKLITHPDNPVSTLKSTQVAAFFLKKDTTWDGGALVLPVDLPEDSPLRAAFSQAVLRKSVHAVEAYWQQRIFSGRDVPPTRRASEEEVLAYVREHRNAIGYVSISAPETGVKVVSLAD